MAGVVGVIPARGGSKGLPGKNIRPLAGKPLIGYACAAALDSGCLDRLLVSTDDEAIARVAQEYGAELPFLRPPALATDDTPMLDVLVHMLDWLEQQGSQPEAIVLLQPTSPLRTGAHIRACVDLFFRHQPDSVISVVQIPHQYHPDSAMNFDGTHLVPLAPDGLKPGRGRQFKRRCFARNGPAVVVVRPSVLRAGSIYGSTVVGYEMDRVSSIDIDDITDFRIAECLIKDGGA